MVYLTHWFRHEDRAKAAAMFMAAIPMSSVVGSPLSGWVLGHQWLGLAGWRWLFVVEGIPGCNNGDWDALLFDGLAPARRIGSGKKNEIGLAESSSASMRVKARTPACYAVGGTAKMGSYPADAGLFLRFDRDLWICHLVSDDC